MFAYTNKGGGRMSLISKADISDAQNTHNIKTVNDAIELAGGVRSLSRAIGCSPAHISNISNGKMTMGARMSIALAKYLGNQSKPADFRPDLFNC